MWHCTFCLTEQTVCLSYCTLSTNAYTQVLTFWYVGGGNTGVSVRRSDGPQMSANTYSTVHTIIWAIQEKVSFSKTVEKLDFLLYNLLKILLNNVFTHNHSGFAFFELCLKMIFLSVFATTHKYTSRYTELQYSYHNTHLQFWGQLWAISVIFFKNLIIVFMHFNETMQQEGFCLKIWNQYFGFIWKY